MQSTMVNIYKVDVLFNGAEKTFTFVGDILHDWLGHAYIEIPPGIHSIVFMLATTYSSSTASFDEDPIHWTVQDAVLLTDFDEFRCSLVVANLNNNIRSYGFKLKVDHDGETYESHDPSIINDPPVGPPGG
ncbi:MAG: hypothetical protein ACJ76J_07390 [Thermoanaerobaculia bacterium]